MAFAPQERRWHGTAMTDEGDHGGAESLSHGFAVPAPFHKGAKGRGLRIATSARWASSQ